MRPENDIPGSPASWLCYANSDLELARVVRQPKVLLETLCFHTQQAAEKALKAVLVEHSIPFPKTHSVGRLLDLLPSSLHTPVEVQESASLTDYAVFSRYPGEIEDVEEEEYQNALRLAETVVKWAEDIIKQT